MPFMLCLPPQHHKKKKSLPWNFPIELIHQLESYSSILKRFLLGDSFCPQNMNIYYISISKIYNPFTSEIYTKITNTLNN
jgi:hypothetical protein